MNSLKIKILGLTILIFGSAVGLTTWQNLRTQHAIISQVASQKAQILGDTIRNTIVINMANGQNSEVANILERIKKEPSIESIRIFDETGRILVSADAEEIGDLIPAADLLAYRSGQSFYLGSRQTEGYHCALVPIDNAPLCHRCHAQEKLVLGILNIHFSQHELQALQNRGREATLLSSAGVLILLVLTVTGFILYYVDTPIRKVVAAMNLVEQGDFNQARIGIISSNEMALLATKFNLMVERLRNLMRSTVLHEREMAIAQEKLAHHDEIRCMNATLEERLREIEFLNVTLEERIEEIEEANFKIADLASDLEAKNTTLAQAVSRLSALYKMGLALNSTMDIDRLFDLLLRKATETLNAQVGHILLLDRDSWSLKVGSLIGWAESTDPTKRIPLRPGGVSHWVIENREPLLIKKIEEAKAFSRLSRLGYTRETIICAPLMIKEEVIGTLTMANRRDGLCFTSDDLELLTTIAAQASIAMRNVRLYEDQQSTYLSTVQALVSTIEASDAYTRGHSERVTRYSLALARHLGLAPESVKTLEEAAVLHDIGKIGIETSLLHKEGRLSDDDIDVLHQHPSIGVHILEPIHFLKDVRKIIEQHHERYDGKGYPHGLAGEVILPEARILAVADAYDAMTSDRPYRSALTQYTAMQEIRENAGSQFDPQVAQALFDMWQMGTLDEVRKMEG